MKRILLITTVIIGLTATALYSFDFGLTIDNSSAVTTTDGTEEISGFVQADRLSLWMQIPLGEYWKFHFRGFGGFTYQDAFYYLADLERFELSGRVPADLAGASLFTMRLGRFRLGDFSNKVVSHIVDGLSFGATYPEAIIKFAAGYTAFILAPSSQIALSKADVEATRTSLEQAINEGQFFGSPRALAALTIQFPELLLRQDITLSLLAQEDLRPLIVTEGITLLEEGETDLQPELGGPVDTQYAGIGISGPIVPPLYHTITFYLGTGRMLAYLSDKNSPTGNSYQFTPVLGFMASGGLRFFVQSFLFSRIALDVVFASGDADADGLVEGNREGNYDGFVPITGNIGTLSFAPKLSNIMSVSASYSLKPFSFLSGSILARLQSSISVSLLFKPSAGPTSEGGLDPTLTDDFSYLGSEFDATLNFRPMSDLGLGLRVGMFLPNGEVFDSDNQEPQIKGSLELSFSM